MSRKQRVVASNGYVLAWVGKDHHLADCRGYVYEHRLVAESKVGRRLNEGEMVHHINGVRSDNRPENLEVVANQAEHFVHHRTVNFNYRLPGEENPLIACACGCGAELNKFDTHGRPRQYLHGHQSHGAPNLNAVLHCVRLGITDRSAIIVATGLSYAIVTTNLWRLKQRGVVEQVRRGVFAVSRDAGEK